MALTQEEFTILLKAKSELGEILLKDAAEVKRATGQMQREQNSLQAKLRRTGKVGSESMRKLATGAKKALSVAKKLVPGWALVASSILSVAAAQQAAAQSGEFRLGIAEIRTLLPEAADGAQELAQGVLDLSTANNQLRADVTSGLYDTISAGFSDSAQALDVLTRSSDLAVAASGNTAESVDLVTTSLNAYRLEADAAADVTDIWFTTVREGKTRLSELAGSIGPVLPLASTLGITLEQVAAAIAAMTKQGIATPQAVTLLKSLFASLIRSGENLNAVFAEGGEHYDSNTLRAKGLASVLAVLQRETATEAELMDVLGGNVEAMNAVLALSGENARTFEDALAALENRAGSAGRALAQVRSEDAFKVGQAAQAAKNEWLGLGDAINEALADAIEKMGGVEGVAGAVRSVAQGLAPILSGLIGSAGDLASRFVDAHGGVDLTIKKVELWGAVLAQFVEKTAGAAAGALLPNSRPFLETAAAGRNPVLNESKSEFLDRLLSFDAPSELADIVGDLSRALDMQDRGVSAGPGFVAAEVIDRQLRALQEESRVLLDARREEKVAAQARAVAEAERLQALRAEIAQLSRARAAGVRSGSAAAGVGSLPDFLSPPGASDPGLTGPPTELFKKMQADREKAAQRLKDFKDLQLGLDRELASTNAERLAIARQLEEIALSQLAEKVEELGLDKDQAEVLRQKVVQLAALNKERALGQDGLPSIPDEAAEALARFEEKVKSARVEVLNAAEGSLGNFFLDLAKNIKSSKEAFQDFARSFLADLARIFTQLVAIRAIEAIGLFAADGGVSPGTISGPSPVPAGIPTKAYSHGGVASSPQMAIFGEGRTREAFVPLPDNRRIPVKMEGGGGTVIQLSVTVPVETFDAKSFDDGILARAKVIGQAVISELVSDPALRGTVRQVAAGRA